MELFIKILLFALIPVGTMLAGGFSGIFFTVGHKFRSIILHFAAGIVFSVVAVELLPDIVENAQILDVSIGFAAGILVLMSIKHFFHATEHKETHAGETTSAKTGTIPVAMLAGIGIDIFIDGILIGTGFAAGENEGILLTVALAIEIFSLGLAVAVQLKQDNIKKSTVYLVIISLPMLILVGASIGAFLLSYLSPDAMEILLSFGLAALLFLVTEELLIEAHEDEKSDTPLVSATFFVGFLLFLILGMLA